METMQRLAKLYHYANIIETSAIDVYKSLAILMRTEVERLERIYIISRIPEDPYSSFDELIKDFANGTIKVFTGGEPHPVWSEEDNTNFRILHDYYGHYICNAPFTLKGEVLATLGMFDIFKDYRHQQILFTEIIGQGLYRKVYLNDESFSPQKACIISQNIFRDVASLISNL